jgi:hypothetical protein
MYWEMWAHVGSENGKVAPLHRVEAVAVADIIKMPIVTMGGQ